MALFTFLLRRQGQPHSRDQLVDLLWSEDQVSRARHSLSQSVSLINKMLGCEAIAVPSKDEVVLREGYVWSDVTEFERCAAQHRQRDARTLWRGNLLEGLWIHNAPNYERWLEAERRRLLETMRRALHELLATTRTEGDWEQMRSVAESALELDPLDEAAMLASLVALTLLGERTLALRRYGLFTKRLADELGAEPGPEMRDWARRQRSGLQAARRGSGHAGEPGRVAEAAAPPSAKPLYGRMAEFARLWQAWTAARGGQGGCVVLVGPAGIGKSALAEKLADQVRVAGGAVCAARCFQTERCVPFAPVSALVRQMAELPGFVALSQVWISELSRLAPELRERFPNAPPALGADDSVRHRVCEATCRAGESISYEEPLLMVVDNVQDADETTLALLHYYGRQAGTQRTLLVCVARAGEGGEPSEFAEQAKAQGYGQVQAVGPLEDAHIQRIVSDVLAQRGLATPAPVVESVARISRGNPLHATELSLAIPAEDGRPASDWLLRGVDEPRSGAERFEQSAMNRLAALSAAARSVTAALAVAGRPVAEHEVLEVTQLGPTSLASAVFELEAAQLLRRDGAKLGFAHDSYAPLAGAALAEAERAAVHARLASVLAESAARNPAAQMEVALHLERAGRSTQARSHGLAAAEFAGSVGAVRERADALELVRRVGSAYDGHVEAALAACYLGLRQFERVDALCQEARARTRLPDELKPEFRYLQIAADHYCGREPLFRICAALEELLAQSGMEQFASRNDAMTLLLRTADKTCNVKLVRATARTLWRSDSGRAGTSPSAHSLFARAYVYARYYWPQRAYALLVEAQRQAEREGNWELDHACRDGLGVVLKQLGRFSESSEQFRYSLALGRKTLNQQAQVASLVNLGVVELARGDFQAAVEYLDEAEQLDRLFPNWFHRVYRLCNQGEVALESGRIDEASDKYDQALARALQMGERRIAMMACAGLALCAKARGDSTVLATRCVELRSIAVGMERVLHDRWKIESAYAWDLTINRGDPGTALARLDRALFEMRRRDVDHWLRLQLEALRVEEYSTGRVAGSARLRLADLAGSYAAKGIVAEALAGLPPSSDTT